MKKLLSIMMAAGLAIAINSCADKGQKAVDVYCDAVEKVAETVEKAPDAEAAMKALQDNDAMKEIQTVVKENADYKLTDGDKEKIKAASLKLMRAMNKYVNIPEDMIVNEVNSQVDNATTLGEIAKM